MASTAEAQIDLDRRWRPALMSFFRRRVKDPCEAEDLTQDVFLRVLATGKPVERPDAYIFQIASNLLADRARRQSVRHRHRCAASNEPIPVDPIDPLRVMTARHEFAAVVAALRELPERTQAVFVLYKFEHMSQDAIGDVMGISASAVKQHVARAMVRLTAAMRSAR